MKTFKSLSEMIDLFKNNKQLNTNERMNDNLICNIMEDYDKFVIFHFYIWYLYFLFFFINVAIIAKGCLLCTKILARV